MHPLSQRVIRTALSNKPLQGTHRKRRAPERRRSTDGE